MQCPTCKGTGKAQVRWTNHTQVGSACSGQYVTDCWRCDGRGNMPKTFLEDTIDWCKCDSPTFGSYPQGPHGKCSIPKEHVHCNDCGLVYQLG